MKVTTHASILDGTEFFECSCGSDEHTLRFVYDEESYSLHCCVYLNQYRSLLKRVWTACKYVFGYRCRYGHWDVWSMHSQDAMRMRAMVDRLIKDRAESGMGEARW